MDWAFDRKAHLLPLKTAEASVADIVASPTSTVASSPVSSEGDRRFSLHSLKSRARRSISGREAFSAGSRSSSQSSHFRKLSKSRHQSTASISSLTHRDTGLSDESGHSSIAEIPGSPGSLPSIGWQSQKVDGICSLEQDTHLLRTRTPYLVVTSEYIIKLKSRSDVFDLFPWLPEKPAQETPGATPEPLVVIPISAVVSVFPAESTRPSFGIEVWWKGSCGASFQQASFFFNLPSERDEQMHNIVRAMRVSQHEDSEAILPAPEVLKVLEKIHESEEPGFRDRKVEVFPVVPRASTRKTHIKKVEDSSKKPQESPSFYLVVGTYLCHFVVINKGKSGEPVHQHTTFGLLTLERLRGDWAIHEERFNLTFRHPFAPRVVLELSSRFYRRIIRVFGVADRYLKPTWPQMWQSTELFHVSGFREPQYLTPREDFGGVRRTLDAYLAAYRCRPVEWEINWRTRFGPEFQLLPAKKGARYSSLQLLAVLRALRYNDYFNSLSFRDVDLTVLSDAHDRFATSKGHVAHLSRTCVTLNADEIEILQQSSVLHQEFHALAFCSETLQQIDFSKSSTSPPSRSDGDAETPTMQFLTPILNLLRADITICSRLILAGNTLCRSDFADLVESLEAGKIHGLDLSHCGLCGGELRDLVAPLLDRPQPLQSLSLSENPGRLSVGFLPQILHNLVDLRELNLRGTLQSERNVIGPCIPLEALEPLKCLEVVDLSGFKISPSTLEDLCAFLEARTRYPTDWQVPRFRRLILNHCGITGSQAAKLCRAVVDGSGTHLSISGNPLEDGIEDLADAIQQSQTPAGFYMEVVEFREESNYLLLMKALTKTKSVSLLSLAGTAPTPWIETTTVQPCSSEMVEALSDFFANNQSIQYLDMSGVSGKLEDGQLAKGFARCLTGLSKNTTLTHLRIRNQNLHDDASTLGVVLSKNKTLRMLDCQDNDINISGLGFLVSSLKSNTTIVDFPFSATERTSLLNNILRGLKKGPHPAPPHATKVGGGDRLKGKEDVVLKDVLNRQFTELDGYIARNRQALEKALGRSVDFELATDSLEGIESTWVALGLEGAMTDQTGGLGPEDVTPIANGRPRAAVRSSDVGPDTSQPAPYHVRHGDDGEDSPTDTLDPVSETSTPPEMAMAMAEAPEDDPMFKQMMQGFKASGFAAG